MRRSVKTISIPLSLRVRTILMQWFQPLYKKMGDLETWVVRTDLADIKIEKPVYVTSLARSGTTIISEILSQHQDTCYHTYGDFPSVYTPYWKNWIKQRQIVGAGVKSERAHQDRIKINNDSIEAFEEVLWMYFHKGIHLDGIARPVDYVKGHPFNSYYIDHIKKHLLVKKSSRYLAKANYNSNRIEYLLELFPDAKFIVPIRHPINHLASLEKQHNKFLAAGLENSNIDKQLAASGHFEFGQLREVIDFSNGSTARQIKTLFSQDQEIRAWSEYWLAFYRNMMDLKNKSKVYDKAIKFIKYEDLCDQSEACIDEILEHVELGHSNSDALKAKYTGQLSRPDYYKMPYSDQHVELIMKITQPLASVFRYDTENHY